MAAGGNFAEIVDLLLKRGASVNAPNREDGTTALMWAANAGYSEVVQRLLRSGADVDLVARDGWTAVKAAKMAGHDDIVRLLREQI